MDTRLLKDTVDTEKRTVKMVFTSEKPVKTYRWKGWDIEEFNEVLSMDPKHMRRGRLDKGAVPLLDSHQRWNLSNQLGVVVDAQSVNERLEGTVKFSKRKAVQEIYEDVLDGTISNGSVGYKVYQYEDISKPGDKIPTLRAIDWELLEMSLVPVGADENAGTMNGKRSEENELNECEIIFRKEIETNKPNMGVVTMDEKEKQAKLAAEQAEAKIKEEREAAVKAETKRCLDIRALVKDAGLDAGLADEYIQRGVSVETAKTNIELFKKYAAEQTQTRVTATAPTVSVNEDNAVQRREGLTEMILHRVDSQNFKMTDRARVFAGKSLIRALEDIIGRKQGETDYDFAQRAMSSSDLPLILANVAEKSAQMRYQLQPRTYSRWTSRGSLRNYKEASQVRGGDHRSLLERNEKGEYVEASIGEEQEKVQLKQYGRKHIFTDKMIVNDDLGMILDIANETGVAVSRLENKLVYNVLKNNPTMADSVALFHADHNNLGTTGAIGETTFKEAFKAMRSQKTVDSEDTINAPPKFLIVGPELEVAAKKFMATNLNPQTSSDVNVFAGTLDIIVESEISDDSYFFAADPSVIPTVKLFNLEGQSGPKAESRFNWDNDAIELKVGHNVTAAPLDYRGLFKNKAT